LAKRDLPIFFNSDGGLVRLDNRVLTRLLRLELASALTTRPCRPHEGIPWGPTLPDLALGIGADALGELYWLPD
jgi:hypothetical protein